MNIRKLTAPYFALQALAVLAWWLTLWLYPKSRRYFMSPNSDEIFLLAFWLPDLALIVIGSFTASFLCWRERASANMPVWLVIGALGYATLYCLSLSLFTNSAWVSVVMMAASLGGSIILGTLFLYSPEALFRQASQAASHWNLIKTLGQIVVFWSFFLFALPALIERAENEIGIIHFQFSGQHLLAAGLFGLLSALGLWSGITMAWLGAGTPLPVDGTRRLVVRGPYAFVRNPMALAGMGQGLAVGIYFGSVLVMLYAIAGGFVWNYVARPLEEAELVQKFGASCERYVAEVKCWVPRLTPYVMTDAEVETISRKN